MAYADAVAPQLEVVEDLLTGFFDEAKSLYNEFKKVKSSEVSGRNNRMPILLRPGGGGGKVDLDNGNLGAGGAPKFDYTAMTPVDFTYNIAWSLKSKFTTDSTAKSVVDVVQLTIAESIKEQQVRIDKHLHTSGTGILAQISSGGGTTTWVMSASSTYPFGAYLLRPGMPVSVFAVGQGTLRGSAVIVTVDRQSATVTVDSDPSTSNTDVVCVDGLSVAANTWTYGIPYWNNNSTAGSYLGWTRSSYPEVRTPTVNANGAALTPDLINELLAYVDSELGEEVTNTGDYFWYLNPKRHYDLTQYLTMISEVELSGDNGQIDAGHSRKKNRKFSGIRIVTSPNADPTRLDLIDKDNVQRVVYREPGWLKSGGQTIHLVPNTSSSYNATEISYLIVSQQFAAKNPRRGGFISALARTI